MRVVPVIAAIAAVVVIGVMSSIFIVDERKQALVLQFGQVKQVKTEPGLGIKWPSKKLPRGGGQASGGTQQRGWGVGEWGDRASTSRPA